MSTLLFVAIIAVCVFCGLGKGLKATFRFFFMSMSASVVCGLIGTIVLGSFFKGFRAGVVVSALSCLVYCFSSIKDKASKK